ncbi:hypothetical protein BC834DRAFT_916342 [Gloeopeniophorella convolvens]|nr:hypothetical protein BC834DRAFT_920650 [Gloeopeniophorella convolvens]KAI0257957.1 hypothetical protein BC834DRAFT_916342 [Gloeopeniophorella convolvens]
MRSPPRTRTRAPSRAARDRRRALTSTAMPLRAVALPSTLHLGSPPVGTPRAEKSLSQCWMQTCTNRHRALGTSVLNDTRIITPPCSMEHVIYISSEGGGLVPMASFRAVMDASWRTTALPPSHRDPHSSGIILSYLTMQNIGFLCKLRRHYTIPLRNTSTQSTVRRAHPLTSSFHELLHPGTRGACCWPRGYVAAVCRVWVHQ